MNHLTGRALLWGTADWERQSPACSAFETFSLGLRKVFLQVWGGQDTPHGLMWMCRGDGPLADFAINFCIKARESTWNSSALCEAFVFKLVD